MESYICSRVLDVSKKEIVIDVVTKCSGNTVIGVVYIDVRLGKRERGYLEVSGGYKTGEGDYTMRSNCACGSGIYTVTIGRVCMADFLIG